MVLGWGELFHEQLYVVIKLSSMVSFSNAAVSQGQWIRRVSGGRLFDVVCVRSWKSPGFSIMSYDEGVSDVPFGIKDAPRRLLSMVATTNISEMKHRYVHIFARWLKKKFDKSVSQFAVFCGRKEFHTTTLVQVEIEIKHRRSHWLSSKVELSACIWGRILSSIVLN